MSSEPSSVDPQAVEQTKQQIRGIVDEITALSKQDVQPEEFYNQFLQRVVEALAAVGGAIWTIADGNQLQLAYQINLKKSMLDQPGDHQVHHTRLLAKVAQSGEGLLVPPHSGAGDEDEGANPTEMLLVLAPLRGDKQTEAIVEIFQRPTPQPAERTPTFLLICVDGLERLGAQGHQTFLLALAADPQRPGELVHVLHVQRHQLADPQAGGVDRLQNGPVAQPQQRLGVRGPKQRLDLLNVQELGQVFVLLGRANDAGRRRFNGFEPHQELVEASQGGELPGGCRLGVSAVAHHCQVRANFDRLGVQYSSPKRPAGEGLGVGDLADTLGVGTD